MTMYNYFEITSVDVSAIMTYAGNLIADFMPLIVIFIGLAIGFAIFREIKR